MKTAHDEVMNLLEQVLASGHLARGRFVQQAEAQLSQILCHDHLSLTSNGTGGIHVGLKALDLHPGDEVITTSYTFSSPLNMILECGAIPVFVDQDESYRMKVDQLEKVITSKTKGILAVDIFGLVNDYEQISKIAKKHGLWLLSDSCQSLGSPKSTNYHIMKYCDVVAGSFFDTKHISTGEGGLVLARDSELLERIDMYISHGQPRGVQYQYEVIGLNYRPTDVQAAILLPKLQIWAENIALRQHQVELFSQTLEPFRKWVRLPKYSRRDVPSQYPIQVDSAVHGRLVDFLKKSEVHLKPQYPKALHQYPVYATRSCTPVDLQNSEQFGSTTICLPIGAAVSPDGNKKLYEAFSTFFQQSI